MKLSEKEIVIGGVLLIIVGALVVNYFWSGSSVKFCGDGVCDSSEEGVCKLDCSWCGDGVCTSNECDIGCNNDCSLSQCENRLCEPEKGENCINTPNDCKCEGGYCNTETKQCDYQSCGNGVCDSGENTINCPNDCHGEEYVKEDTSDIDYPIIFVHGHSMTEGESSYSLHAFSEFQDKLQEDRLYEDRGYILASSEKYEFSEGQWTNTQKPVSLRTTYYLGEYSSVTDTVSSDDNYQISEYSKRLSKVVDNVLYATGKNKVIIIAHSMGGLVSRYYIENLGGDSKVDKLVTIGTPNHGTYGYSSFGCESSFGRISSSPECDDMDGNSDFIKNLNSKKVNVDILTIVGVSQEAKNNLLFCPDSNGADGVVCKSSVFLQGAQNKFVSSNGLSWDESTFHSALIHPSEVPEVYNDIVKFLNS